MLARLWSFIKRCGDLTLIIVKTLPRDLLGLYILIKYHVLIKYNVYRRQDFIHLFRQNVNRYQSKACFVLDDRSLSFQQSAWRQLNSRAATTLCLFSDVKVEDLSNQLANFFAAEGYARGDVLALLLENSLEYPCVWVGLSKIGCITALINTNLRAHPLLHSIRTVKAKTIITSKQILSGKASF